VNETPFGLGFKSGIKGEDPRVCPFVKMTEEWFEWNKGQKFGVDYMIAFEELKEQMKND
jgi:ribosome modulation factor